MGRTCSDCECTLCKKCLLYKENGRDLLFDLFGCNNYSAFKSNNPFWIQYEEAKINKFLKQNNLERDHEENWSDEKENEFMALYQKIKEKILQSELER